MQEVHRDGPGGPVCRNCRHVGPERRGGGSMPAARRISHTVDGAIVTPSFASSPWIRRYPQSGFSFARRTARGTVGGRPGLRLLLVSYLLAVSLRCQASSVAGVTGKISVQHRWGSSRASAASHTALRATFETAPVAAFPASGFTHWTLRYPRAWRASDSAR
ncbi:MAG: hypothetical protein QOG05_4084 [Streptosporangiaceae bacterium]|jgi:hypothetical protein|nr:hypothetical protein [Streptosporangiaceae bacterium]